MSSRTSVIVRSLPLMLAAGCHSLRPVGVADSRGKAVRVDFRAPRTVSVTGRGGGSLRLDGVTGLEGRAVAVRPPLVGRAAALLYPSARVLGVERRLETCSYWPGARPDTTPVVTVRVYTWFAIPVTTYEVACDGASLRAYPLAL